MSELSLQGDSSQKTGTVTLEMRHSDDTWIFLKGAVPQELRANSIAPWKTIDSIDVDYLFQNWELCCSTKNDTVFTSKWIW